MSFSEIEQKQILRGVELLWLCQELKSADDGIDRPDKDSYDKSKTLDDFAMDVRRSANNMLLLLKLLPMIDQLTTLGRKLEAEGKITVNYGADYPEAVVNYLLVQHSINE